MQTIRTIITETVNNNPNLTVEGIAKLIVTNITEQQKTEFLIDTIKPLVMNQISKTRRQAINQMPKGPTKPERIATWWDRLLEERVPVQGAMMRLGDCTITDLQHCIQARQELINDTEKQINHYRKLQQLLADTGAKTLRDVPPEQRDKKFLNAA